MLIANGDRLAVTGLGERLRAAVYNVIEACDGPSTLAAGLLMATLGLGKREAFERLRNRARSRRARLDDVAAELVRAYDEAGRLTQQYADAGARKNGEPRSSLKN